MQKLSFSLDAAKSMRRDGTMAASILKLFVNNSFDLNAVDSRVEELGRSHAKRVNVGSYCVIFEENAASRVVTKINRRQNLDK